MMKRDWDLLFSEYDLRAVLENQLNQVEDKVRAVDPVRFETSTDDLLSATIASELVFAPIELHEDQLSVSPRDAKVDVSYDPDRAFFSPGPALRGWIGGHIQPSLLWRRGSLQMQAKPVHLQCTSRGPSARRIDLPLRQCES